MEAYSCFPTAYKRLKGADIQVLEAKSTKALNDSDTAIGKAKTAANEAEAAKIESGKAKDVASIAESVAGGARQEADSFENAIKEAKRDASEAKALLSEVRQRAAGAESHAASAERKVADRHISPVQLDRIHKSLVRWRGHDIRLALASVNGDGEMWTYGRELLNTFGSISGWSIMLFAVGRNNGLSGLSVRIEGTASELDKALANDLVIALHDAGVQTSGPERPAPYAVVQGGGGGVRTGVFNPQDPRFDPKAAPNQNISIEIGQKQ